MGIIYKNGIIYGNNPLIESIGVGGGYAPIGTIIAYMGTTAPQDYLVCNGATYNISDYKQLSHFIETQFGSINYFGGDGITTFAVPDLRGEFLRGTGTNGHNSQGSGSNVGIHQDATEHFMILKTNQTRLNFYGTTPTSPQNVDGTGSAGYTKAGMNITAAAYTASADTSTCYKSRPTNTSVLYCIKAICAGDVYSTEERVVGTWVDGKPIYQTTIDFGTLPNASTKEVVHGIANIETSVGLEGIAVGAGTTTGSHVIIPLPMVGVATTASSISIYSTATKIYITTGSNRSDMRGYITLRYTKTTD